MHVAEEVRFVGAFRPCFMFLFRFMPFIVFTSDQSVTRTDWSRPEVARGLDPWRWPNGSQPLGTRM